KIIPRLLGRALKTCLGGESFTGSTRVLLASGTAVPISQLKAGQKVLATNTKTGKTQPETVTAVLVRHDTDKYDLKVKAGGHTAVIHTTSSHLFWVPGTGGHGGRWVKAAALKYRTRLRTPSGSDTATVLGGWIPQQPSGWMWDITVPGNNDHDFYIDTAATAVLVHNMCGNAPRVFAVDSSGEATALPVYTIDSSLYPDVADNFNNAMANGESRIVTRMTGRSAIRANRAAAQAGETRPDMLGMDAQGGALSWEEFPFASTYEGGSGATLRLINRSQNISHGRDSLWPFLRDNGINDGDQYYVQVG
ncbi:MAG: hypothetical protein J2P29_02065, partial [Actinobacteria bacterium]|nr:hypothetical protein [Actinomycetota bacterium]